MPENFDRSHFPPVSEAWACGRLRASPSSIAIVCSAAVITFDCGALATTTPCLVAAATSTLSTPTPAWPTAARRLGRAGCVELRRRADQDPVELADSAAQLLGRPADPHLDIEMLAQQGDTRITDVLCHQDPRWIGRHVVDLVTTAVAGRARPPVDCAGVRFEIASLVDGAGLAAAIRRRELSCREVVAWHLDRIATVNPRVNAIVSLRPEEALADAEAPTARAPAAARSGRCTGCRSRSRTSSTRPESGRRTAPRCSPTTSPPRTICSSARLRAAGAIVVGKTNTPEFGIGSHTFNAVFGATRNPWALERSAGGSSGGAGAALAAGHAADRRRLRPRRKHP